MKKLLKEKCIEVRLYISVTVKKIDMKFKDMTLAQIWEQVQKPFNFA